MAINNPACEPLNDYVKERIKKSFKSDLDRDEATRRALALQAKLDAASVKFKEKALNEAAAVASNRAVMDNILVERLGKANNINPGNRLRVEAFLSNWIGIHYGAINANAKLTDVGAVRGRLLEARRLGSNITSLLVDFQTNKGVNRLTDRFRVIAKAKGITGTEADLLLTRAREMGGIAKHQSDRIMHEAGRAYLQNKFSLFTQDMISKGFTQPEVDELLSLSHDIFSRMNSVRVLSESMGVNVGYTEGIGFVPRMFTPSAQKGITAAERDLATSLYDQLQLNSNPESLSYAFQKSRSTFNYIPEDEFLISHFLDVRPTELRELIKESKLAEFMHNKLSPGEIDNLVDSGLLSKVPMFSDEMAKYVISQYGELPFKEISEVLVTNPNQLYQAYRDALQKASGNSLMLKQIVEDGARSGWSVTPQRIKEAPDVYKDYVLLTADDIKKGYNAYAGKDIYVHPEVLGTYKALQDVVTSPEKMGTVANIMHSLGGLLIQSMLIQPGYVLRNLGQNIIGSFAVGNNLLRSYEGYSDVVKAMRSGLEGLDDVTATYKMGGELVTKRRLFEESFLHLGNNFAPLSNELKAGELKGFGNFQRGLGYLINYTQAHGLIRPAKPTDSWAEGLSYALEQLKNIQSVPFSYMAFAAQLNESAFKWSTIMSRADNSAGNRIGQFFQATKGVALDDFAEEMREIDKFFFMWDDVGKIPDFVGRNVMPFAQVLMKSPPAVFRHAMKNPKAYMNYIRVRQFMNEGAAEDGEELPEAGIAQWKIDGGLINLWKDPQTNNWVGLMSNSFDPISDATIFFGKTARRIKATQGVYTGTTEEQYRFAQEKYSFKDFIAESLKNTPPITRALTEAATGIDVRTGQNIDTSEKFITAHQTFLGYYHHPFIRSLMTMYPPLDNFNNANFFNMFGVPEVTDPRNPLTPIIEGTRSPLTGNQRYEARGKERYLPEMQTAIALAVRSLGIPLTVVDAARQVQFNQSSFSKIQGDLTKNIKEMSYLLYSAKVKDRAEIDRIYADVKQARDMEFKMQITDLRLKLWMVKHGVPPKDVWEKIARGGFNDLPPLAQDEAERLALDYTKQLAKDDSRYNEVIKRFKK